MCWLLLTEFDVSTTVASLSHWASSFVYITMGVTKRVARVHLRQLRLVEAMNPLAPVLPEVLPYSKVGY